ncbi:tetratricopeptide repeat protein, partial [Neoroseomonas rubea]|uniref:tetratricopeptide repeat protein n=1 Tax=Neoroseomonas rubea TaxID=2748666 RepID=UPI0018DF3CC3
MRPLKASLLGAVAALALAGPAAAQPTPGALGILLQQARHWQEQNRPDLALRAYERVLATAPRNPEALAGAAEAQAALGNRTEAEALIARL